MALINLQKNLSSAVITVTYHRSLEMTVWAIARVQRVLALIILHHLYIVACQAHPVLVFSYMFRALSHNSLCVDQEKLYMLVHLKRAKELVCPVCSGE